MGLTTTEKFGVGVLPLAKLLPGEFEQLCNLSFFARGWLFFLHYPEDKLPATELHGIRTFNDEKCGGDDARHDVRGDAFILPVVLLIQVHYSQVASLLDDPRL